MKKFFTSIPLQQPGSLSMNRYEAVGNEKLSMGEATAFPILTAVNGYVEAGESFRLIAIAGNSEAEQYNLNLLRGELNAICDRQRIVCPNGVETVEAAPDQRVSSHVAVFQRLIAFAEDDDELFACLTYGTKPQSMSLLTAIRYACRLKRNVSVSCLVYGNMDRGRDSTGKMIVTGAQVYDETAMAQLDDITRLLAERGVEQPEKVIDSLLTF